MEYEWIVWAILFYGVVSGTVGVTNSESCTEMMLHAILCGLLITGCVVLLNAN
jgi:hypothetical protein